MARSVDRTSINCRNWDNKRTRKGSVLIEGIAGILLVLLVLQVCLFFVVHVWQICVYRQKIATVASEAAQQVADQASVRSYYDSFSASNNLKAFKQNARTEALKSLKAFGLPAQNSDVKITLDGRLVTVRVKCTKLSAIGVLSLLPNLINVEEMATAPVRIVMPPALVVITSSSGASVAMPAYGNSLKPVDFVRHNAQFSASVPTPVQCQSTTLGTVIDTNWLNWSPVYP